MHPILRELRGTDRRSIGTSNAVAAKVLAHPRLFGPLFEGMFEKDPVVRMRAADAIEKITLRCPEYLRPFTSRLINEVAYINQKEIRWHVAQMIPRLDMTLKERRAVSIILRAYLNDPSSIVRTFSMQALAEIALHDNSLLNPTIRRLERLTRSGTPAMRSRGRRLIAALSRRKNEIRQQP